MPSGKRQRKQPVIRASSPPTATPPPVPGEEELPTVQAKSGAGRGEEGLPDRRDELQGRPLPVSHQSEHWKNSKRLPYQ